MRMPDWVVCLHSNNFGYIMRSTIKTARLSLPLSSFHTPTTSRRSQLQRPQRAFGRCFGSLVVSVSVFDVGGGEGVHSLFLVCRHMRLFFTGVSESSSSGSSRAGTFPFFFGPSVAASGSLATDSDASSDSAGVPEATARNTSSQASSPSPSS